MGSIQEKIIQALKNSDRPLTTIEIARSVWGNYPEWEHSSRRSNIYGKLKILEKQGCVRNSTSLIKKDKLWWLVS